MLLRFVFEFGDIWYVPSDLVYIETVTYEPFILDIEADISYRHGKEETLGIEEHSAYRDVGRFVLLKILYEIGSGKTCPYDVFYEDHLLAADVDRDILDYLDYTGA